MPLSNRFLLMRIQGLLRSMHTYLRDEKRLYISLVLLKHRLQIYCLRQRQRYDAYWFDATQSVGRIRLCDSNGWTANLKVRPPICKLSYLWTSAGHAACRRTLQKATRAWFWLHLSKHWRVININASINFPGRSICSVDERSAYLTPIHFFSRQWST
jgi:hypothetical protein